MPPITCPNCGDHVSPSLSMVKMLTCPSCTTTLMLNDAAVKMAGEQGVMHEVPLLFGLHDSVAMGGVSVTIHGHARYSYGRGTWDEFWGVTPRGEPRWISVDEGDIVLQAPINTRPAGDPAMRIGQVLSLAGEPFDVIERDAAECLALRGNFDEPLFVGETYRFINAQSARGDLLSGEFGPDGAANWYLGRWFDPFDIRVRPGR